jgi:CheY-like chemotaxis protein
MSYRKVLIVDDDPVFLALAEEMFLDAGAVEVASAEDGGKAIDALVMGLDPDLLICDLNMPAHDGVSLIRAIAEWGIRKVLIISGEPNPVIDSVTKLARMQGLDILDRSGNR